MSKDNIKGFLYYSWQDQAMKISEFSNPSQRDFLTHEATSVVKKVGRTNTSGIQTAPSSNGIWYYQIKDDFTQTLLAAKEAPMTMVNLFFGKVNSLLQKCNFSDLESLNRLRHNVADSIKLFNANNMSKLQQLNQNVQDLSGMMKNNMNRLVSNMGDLEVVEKKSSLMSQLSMSLENDSRLLQKKMKRRQRCIRLVVAAIVIALFLILAYFIFG